MGVKKEIVYNNLATMFEAGLPIKRVITAAASGVPGRFAKDLLSLNDAVSRGSTLSEGMAARPRSFEPMDVLLVQAGETSGTVVQSMKGLATWYAFRARLRRDVTVGMLYPLLLFHFAALVAPLPGLFLSGYDFSSYFAAVLQFLAVLYVPAAVIWLVRRVTPPDGLVRWFMDAGVLKVPLLGGALLHLAMGRFSRVFHTLYTAGIPISEALAQAIGLCGNAQVARWLEGARRSVGSGNPASEGFGPRVPRHFVYAWANGEESGSLDVVTDRLANMEADAAHFGLSQLAIWTPRILYVLIMLWVGVQILLKAGFVLAPLRL